MAFDDFRDGIAPPENKIKEMFDGVAGKAVTYSYYDQRVESSSSETAPDNNKVKGKIFLYFYDKNNSNIKYAGADSYVEYNSEAERLAIMKDIDAHSVRTGIISKTEKGDGNYLQQADISDFKKLERLHQELQEAKNKPDTRGQAIIKAQGKFDNYLKKLYRDKKSRTLKFISAHQDNAFVIEVLACLKANYITDAQLAEFATDKLMGMRDIQGYFANLHIAASNPGIRIADSAVIGIEFQDNQPVWLIEFYRKDNNNPNAPLEKVQGLPSVVIPIDPLVDTPKGIMKRLAEPGNFTPIPYEKRIQLPASGIYYDIPSELKERQPARIAYSDIVPWGNMPAKYPSPSLPDLPDLMATKTVAEDKEKKRRAIEEKDRLAQQQRQIAEEAEIIRLSQRKFHEVLYADLLKLKSYKDGKNTTDEANKAEIELRVRQNLDRLLYPEPQKNPDGNLIDNFDFHYKTTPTGLPSTDIKNQGFSAILNHLGYAEESRLIEIHEKALKDLNEASLKGASYFTFLDPAKTKYDNQVRVRVQIHDAECETIQEPGKSSYKVYTFFTPTTKVKEAQSIIISHARKFNMEEMTDEIKIRSYFTKYKPAYYKIYVINETNIQLQFFDADKKSIKKSGNITPKIFERKFSNKEELEKYKALIEGVAEKQLCFNIPIVGSGMPLHHGIMQSKDMGAPTGVSLSVPEKDAELIKSIEENNLEGVKGALKAGANPNVKIGKDPVINIALEKALESKNWDIVEAILEYNVDTSMRGRKYNSAFEMVMSQLEYHKFSSGYSIENEDACNRNLVKITEKASDLSSYYTYPNSKPMQQAIKLHRNDVVAILIGKKGVDINFNDFIAGVDPYVAYNYVQYALINKNPKAAELLLDAGATPWVREQSPYMNTLQSAIDLYYNDIAKKMVVLGAGINTPCYKEYPLGFAILRFNNEMAEFFISRNADLTLINQDYKRTFLHMAEFSQNTEILKILIQKYKELGLSLEPKNSYGETPLFQAAEENKNNYNIETIKLFVEAGADITVKKGDRSLYDVAWEVKKYKTGGDYKSTELLYYLITNPNAPLEERIRVSQDNPEFKPYTEDYIVKNSGLAIPDKSNYGKVGEVYEYAAFLNVVRKTENLIGEIIDNYSSLGQEKIRASIIQKFVRNIYETNGNNWVKASNEVNRFSDDKVADIKDMIHYATNLIMMPEYIATESRRQEFDKSRVWVEKLRNINALNLLDKLFLERKMSLTAIQEISDSWHSKIYNVEDLTRVIIPKGSWHAVMKSGGEKDENGFYKTPNDNIIFKEVTNSQELLDIGRRMGTCIGGKATDADRGEYFIFAFYNKEKQPIATARFTKSRDNKLVLEELTDINNHKVFKHGERAVFDWFMEEIKQGKISIDFSQTGNVIPQSQRKSMTPSEEVAELCGFPVKGGVKNEKGTVFEINYWDRAVQTLASQPDTRVVNNFAETKNPPIIRSEPVIGPDGKTVVDPAVYIFSNTDRKVGINAQQFLEDSGLKMLAWKNLDIVTESDFSRHITYPDIDRKMDGITKFLRENKKPGNIYNIINHDEASMIIEIFTADGMKEAEYNVPFTRDEKPILEKHIKTIAYEFIILTESEKLEFEKAKGQTVKEVTGKPDRRQLSRDTEKGGGGGAGEGPIERPENVIQKIKEKLVKAYDNDARLYNNDAQESKNIHNRLLRNLDRYIIVNPDYIPYSLLLRAKQFIAASFKNGERDVFNEIHGIIENTGAYEKQVIDSQKITEEQAADPRFVEILGKVKEKFTFYEGGHKIYVYNKIDTSGKNYHFLYSDKPIEGKTPILTVEAESLEFKAYKDSFIKALTEAGTAEKKSAMRGIYASGTLMDIEKNYLPALNKKIKADQRYKDTVEKTSILIASQIYNQSPEFQEIFLNQSNDTYFTFISADRIPKDFLGIFYTQSNKIYFESPFSLQTLFHEYWHNLDHLYLNLVLSENLLSKNANWVDAVNMAKTNLLMKKLFSGTDISNADPISEHAFRPTYSGEQSYREALVETGGYYSYYKSEFNGDEAKIEEAMKNVSGESGLWEAFKAYIMPEANRITKNAIDIYNGTIVPDEKILEKVQVIHAPFELTQEYDFFIPISELTAEKKLHLESYLRNKGIKFHYENNFQYEKFSTEYIAINNWEYEGSMDNESNRRFIEILNQDNITVNFQKINLAGLPVSDGGFNKGFPKHDIMPEKLLKIDITSLPTDQAKALMLAIDSQGKYGQLTKEGGEYFLTISEDKYAELTDPARSVAVESLVGDDFINEFPNYDPKKVRILEVGVVGKNEVMPVDLNKLMQEVLALADAYAKELDFGKKKEIEAGLKDKIKILNAQLPQDAEKEKALLDGNKSQLQEGIKNNFSDYFMTPRDDLASFECKISGFKLVFANLTPETKAAIQPALKEFLSKFRDRINWKGDENIKRNYAIFDFIIDVGPDSLEAMITHDMKSYAGIYKDDRKTEGYSAEMGVKLMEYFFKSMERFYPDAAKFSPSGNAATQTQNAGDLRRGEFASTFYNFLSIDMGDAAPFAIRELFKNSPEYTSAIKYMDKVMANAEAFKTGDCKVIKEYLTGNKTREEFFKWVVDNNIYINSDSGYFKKMLMHLMTQESWGDKTAAQKYLADLEKANQSNRVARINAVTLDEFYVKLASQVAAKPVKNGIIVDFDGTLFIDGEIRPNLLKFLALAKESGLEIIIASGDPESAKRKAAELGIDFPVISKTTAFTENWLLYIDTENERGYNNQGFLSVNDLPVEDNISEEYVKDKLRNAGGKPAVNKSLTSGPGEIKEMITSGARAGNEDNIRKDIEQVKAKGAERFVIYTNEAEHSDNKKLYLSYFDKDGFSIGERVEYKISKKLALQSLENNAIAYATSLGLLQEKHCKKGRNLTEEIHYCFTLGKNNGGVHFEVKYEAGSATISFYKGKTDGYSRISVGEYGTYKIDIGDKTETQFNDEVNKVNSRKDINLSGPRLEINRGGRPVTKIDLIGEHFLEAEANGAKGYKMRVNRNGKYIFVFFLKSESDQLKNAVTSERYRVDKVDMHGFVEEFNIQAQDLGFKNYTNNLVIETITNEEESLYKPVIQKATQYSKNDTYQIPKITGGELGSQKAYFFGANNILVTTGEKEAHITKTSSNPVIYVRSNVSSDNTQVSAQIDIDKINTLINRELAAHPEYNLDKRAIVARNFANEYLQNNIDGILAQFSPTQIENEEVEIFLIRPSQAEAPNDALNTYNGILSDILGVKATDINHSGVLFFGKNFSPEFNNGLTEKGLEGDAKFNGWLEKQRVAKTDNPNLTYSFNMEGSDAEEFLSETYKIVGEKTRVANMSIKGQSVFARFPYEPDKTPGDGAEFIRQLYDEYIKLIELRKQVLSQPGRQNELDTAENHYKEGLKDLYENRKDVFLPQVEAHSDRKFRNEINEYIEKEYPADFADSHDKAWVSSCVESFRESLARSNTDPDYIGFNIDKEGDKYSVKVYLVNFETRAKQVQSYSFNNQYEASQFVENSLPVARTHDYVTVSPDCTSPFNIYKGRSDLHKLILDCSALADIGFYNIVEQKDGFITIQLYDKNEQPVKFRDKTGSNEFLLKTINLENDNATAVQKELELYRIEPYNETRSAQKRSALGLGQGQKGQQALEGTNEVNTALVIDAKVSERPPFQHYLRAALSQVEFNDRQSSPRDVRPPNGADLSIVEYDGEKEVKEGAPHWKIVYCHKEFNGSKDISKIDTVYIPMDIADVVNPDTIKILMAAVTNSTKTNLIPNYVIYTDSSGKAHRYGDYKKKDAVSPPIPEEYIAMVRGNEDTGSAKEVGTRSGPLGGQNAKGQTPTGLHDNQGGGTGQERDEDFEKLKDLYQKIKKAHLAGDSVEDEARKEFRKYLHDWVIAKGNGNQAEQIAKEEELFDKILKTNEPDFAKEYIECVQNDIKTFYVKDPDLKNEFSEKIIPGLVRLANEYLSEKDLDKKIEITQKLAEYINCINELEPDGTTKRFNHYCLSNLASELSLNDKNLAAIDFLLTGKTGIPTIEYTSAEAVNALCSISGFATSSKSLSKFTRLFLDKNIVTAGDFVTHSMDKNLTGMDAEVVEILREIYGQDLELFNRITADIPDKWFQANLKVAAGILSVYNSGDIVPNDLMFFKAYLSRVKEIPTEDIEEITKATGEWVKALSSVIADSKKPLKYGTDNILDVADIAELSEIYYSIEFIDWIQTIGFEGVEAAEKLSIDEIKERLDKGSYLDFSASEIDDESFSIPDLKEELKLYANMFRNNEPEFTRELNRLIAHYEVIPSRFEVLMGNIDYLRIHGRTIDKDIIGSLKYEKVPEGELIEEANKLTGQNYRKRFLENNIDDIIHGRSQVDENLLPFLKRYKVLPDEVVYLIPPSKLNEYIDEVIQYWNESGITKAEKAVIIHEGLLERALKGSHENRQDKNYDPEKFAYNHALILLLEENGHRQEITVIEREIGLGQWDSARELIGDLILHPEAPNADEVYLHAISKIGSNLDQEISPEFLKTLFSVEKGEYSEEQLLEIKDLYRKAREIFEKTVSENIHNNLLVIELEMIWHANIIPEFTDTTGKLYSDIRAKAIELKGQDGFYTPEKALAGAREGINGRGTNNKGTLPNNKGAKFSKDSDMPGSGGTPDSKPGQPGAKSVAERVSEDEDDIMVSIALGSRTVVNIPLPVLREYADWSNLDENAKREWVEAHESEILGEKETELAWAIKAARDLYQENGIKVDPWSVAELDPLLYQHQHKQTIKMSGVSQVDTSSIWGGSNGKMLMYGVSGVDGKLGSGWFPWGQAVEGLLELTEANNSEERNFKEAGKGWKAAGNHSLSMAGAMYLAGKEHVGSAVAGSFSRRNITTGAGRVTGAIVENKFYARFAYALEGYSVIFHAGMKAEILRGGILGQYGHLDKKSELEIHIIDGAESLGYLGAFAKYGTKGFGLTDVLVGIGGELTVGGGIMYPDQVKGSVTGMLFNYFGPGKYRLPLDLHDYGRKGFMGPYMDPMPDRYGSSSDSGLEWVKNKIMRPWIEPNNNNMLPGNPFLAKEMSIIDKEATRVSHEMFKAAKVLKFQAKPLKINDLGSGGIFESVVVDFTDGKPLETRTSIGQEIYKDDAEVYYYFSGATGQRMQIPNGKVTALDKMVDDRILKAMMDHYNAPIDAAGDIPALIADKIGIVNLRNYSGIDLVEVRPGSNNRSSIVKIALHNRNADNYVLVDKDHPAAMVMEFEIYNPQNRINFKTDEYGHKTYDYYASNKDGAGFLNSIAFGLNASLKEKGIDKQIKVAPSELELDGKGYKQTGRFADLTSPLPYGGYVVGGNTKITHDAFYLTPKQYKELEARGAVKKGIFEYRGWNEAVQKDIDDEEKQKLGGVLLKRNEGKWEWTDSEGKLHYDINPSSYLQYRKKTWDNVHGLLDDKKAVVIINADNQMFWPANKFDFINIPAGAKVTIGEVPVNKNSLGIAVKITLNDKTETIYLYRQENYGIDEVTKNIENNNKSNKVTPVVDKGSWAAIDYENEQKRIKSEEQARSKAQKAYDKFRENYTALDKEIGKFKAKSFDAADSLAEKILSSLNQNSLDNELIEKFRVGIYDVTSSEKYEKETLVKLKAKLDDLKKQENEVFKKDPLANSYYEKQRKINIEEINQCIGIIDKYIERNYSDHTLAKSLTKMLEDAENGIEIYRLYCKTDEIIGESKNQDDVQKYLLNIDEVAALQSNQKNWLIVKADLEALQEIRSGKRERYSLNPINVFRDEYEELLEKYELNGKFDFVIDSEIKKRLEAVKKEIVNIELDKTLRQKEIEQFLGLEEYQKTVTKYRELVENLNRLSSAPEIDEAEIVKAREAIKIEQIALEDERKKIRYDKERLVKNEEDLSKVFIRSTDAFSKGIISSYILDIELLLAYGNIALETIYQDIKLAEDASLQAEQNIQSRRTRVIIEGEEGKPNCRERVLYIDTEGRLTRVMEYKGGTLVKSQQWEDEATRPALKDKEGNVITTFEDINYSPYPEDKKGIKKEEPVLKDGIPKVRKFNPHKGDIKTRTKRITSNDERQPTLYEANIAFDNSAYSSVNLEDIMNGNEMIVETNTGVVVFSSDNKNMPNASELPGKSNNVTTSTDSTPGELQVTAQGYKWPEKIIPGVTSNAPSPVINGIKIENYKSPDAEMHVAQLEALPQADLALVISAQEIKVADLKEIETLPNNQALTSGGAVLTVSTTVPDSGTSETRTSKALERLKAPVLAVTHTSIPNIRKPVLTDKKNDVSDGNTRVSDKKVSAIKTLSTNKDLPTAPEGIANTYKSSASEAGNIAALLAGSGIVIHGNITEPEIAEGISDAANIAAGLLMGNFTTENNLFNPTDNIDNLQEIAGSIQKMEDLDKLTKDNIENFLFRAVPSLSVINDSNPGHITVNTNLEKPVSIYAEAFLKLVMINMSDEDRNAMIRDGTLAQTIDELMHREYLEIAKAVASAAPEMFDGIPDVDLDPANLAKLGDLTWEEFRESALSNIQEKLNTVNATGLIVPKSRGK